MTTQKKIEVLEKLLESLHATNLKSKQYNEQWFKYGDNKCGEGEVLIPPTYLTPLCILYKRLVGIKNVNASELFEEHFAEAKDLAKTMKQYEGTNQRHSYWFGLGRKNFEKYRVKFLNKLINNYKSKL